MRYGQRMIEAANKEFGSYGQWYAGFLLIAFAITPLFLAVWLIWITPSEPNKS